MSYNFYHNQFDALLVQLVERRFPKPDVVGSSPTGRVFNFLLPLFFYLLMIYLNYKYQGEVAEWLKASDC